MPSEKPIDLNAIQKDWLYPALDAAKLRGKSPKTLANERCGRRGPAVTYVGKTPFYRGADLLRDIERGRVDFAAPAAASSRKKSR